MNEDGSMARVSDLEVIADKFNLKFITIADLVRYLQHNDPIGKQELEMNIPKA
jgi:3,4-dihydroxy 2-butanone 4-phosphate synthase / GTP cyclohydrolase II